MLTPGTAGLLTGGQSKEGTNSEIMCSASQRGPWAAPLTLFQAAWETDVSHGALPWAQGGAVMLVLLSGVY